MPDGARPHPRLNMIQRLAVLPKPRAARVGNRDFLPAIFFIVQHHKPLRLQRVERRVDHAGAWRVVACGQRFDGFDKFITVALAGAQDIQHHQTQFAVTEKARAAMAVRPVSAFTAWG